MPRPPPDPRRLLLLLPTAPYRTPAFVEAARRLGVDLPVASETPSALPAAALVPVPRFALHHVEEDPRELAGRVPYPCVVKPLRLSASRGVIRADSPAQFLAAFERLRRILAAPDVAACGEPARHILVEEFVPGSEHALEGLLVDGELRVLAGV